MPSEPPYGRRWDDYERGRDTQRMTALEEKVSQLLDRMKVADGERFIHGKELAVIESRMDALILAMERTANSVHRIEDVGIKLAIAFAGVIAAYVLSVLR